MTGFYSQKGQKDMRGARTWPKTFLSSNRQIAIARYSDNNSSEKGYRALFIDAVWDF